MRLLCLGFRRAYLKRMHEWLNGCSERTLTSIVYHTSPAIVQQWKNQDEQMKKHEYHITCKDLGHHPKRLAFQVELSKSLYTQDHPHV